MSYSVRADVNFIFGAANVTAWATRDDADDATDIADRITRAIAEADEEIDDLLRVCYYQIPLINTSGTTPVTVRGLSARMAGVRLYESMGVMDYNAESGVARHRLSWHWDYAQHVLAEVRDGKRKLNAV